MGRLTRDPYWDCEGTWMSTRLSSLSEDILGMPYVKGFLTLVSAFVLQIHGPWTQVHWAALVFITADTFVGVYRARYYDDAFTPTILRKQTSWKLIVYGMLYILAFNVGQIGHSASEVFPAVHQIWHPTLLLPHMVGVFIAVTEWESIGRSMRVMGQPWPSFADIFEIGRRLRSGWTDKDKDNEG